MSKFVFLETAGTKPQCYFLWVLQNLEASFEKKRVEDNLKI